MSVTARTLGELRLVSPPEEVGLRPVASLGAARSAHDQRFVAGALAQLVDEVSDYAVLILDVDGHVASWNRGAERIKGYTAAEVVGRHFSVFYPPEQASSGLCDHLLRSAELQGRVEHEGWRVRRDGTQFWANVVITALRSPDGRLIAFGKVTRDLTERRRHEEHLEHLATHDSLSGLPNRRAFVDATSRLTTAGGQPQGGLLLVDVDHFKLINDSFGHAEGDAFIRRVGDLLREVLGDHHGLVGRIGGDEFGLLFYDATHEEMARAAAEAVESIAGAATERYGADLPVSASAGLALHARPLTTTELVGAADRALYEAKRSGRRRWRLA